ncbi:MAG TPA: ATP-binding protein [Candidatus Limnocylindria bacterium]|jgi:signal transduction histidine kinase|nr:ATP-binding protein [Candidatus Limnocylindria bacterium]
MAVETPIIPPNEAERLAAVRRYDILDTPPDGAFDRITALAARLFKVPIAIVSIVDHDRIWFKSHHGIDVEQIDREPGLCASAILQDRPWVINDAPSDPRALTNPLVAGEFGLKFYAGMPLHTRDGYNLGTLCILDFKPRELSTDEMANLEDLAQMVVDELELRLASLKALADAKEREQLKDALMGMLSHELRTPVTTIYGAAQLLSREAEESQSGRGRELFPDVVYESERLMRLIDNLLVLTRLEQGREIETTREPVLIQHVLAEVVEQESRRWPERSINLDLEPGLPTVAGDQVYLEQVVRNVLSNALKYSPADTPVTISAAIADTDDEVEVSVRDRGIGLPAQGQEALFELLARSKDAVRHAPGAGIGLYVCRRLLDAMGGTIWMEPAPDVGTIVTFRMPILQE